MGISERREREKIERRKTILNCARELILQQGVEQVSMDDIARRAELSKATIYLYFSGKDILLNEICEDSARIFLEHLKPFLETGLTGIAAMKCFWRGYVNLFGKSDEMVIVFQVHNFLNPGLPFVSLEEQSRSPYVNAILKSVKTFIDQCKAEGVFDPSLDSDLATRLLLSIFSNSVDNAARMPLQMRKSPSVTAELTKAFQIIVRGFAKEGIDLSSLNITDV